ncbi:MAG TPA: DUF5667 domain-containing protein, partial [Chloroflexota bacterium]|nr:DUF5667 domain-containing protein [Chloroflexota bacterium]
MRELLLAQALDACIDAEHRMTGSAAEVIARQPAWARADLRRLLELATALDAAAGQAVMSEDFRVAARGRLMQRISGETEAAPTPEPGAWLTAMPSRNGVYHARRRPGWVWRAAGGGLLAAVLAVAATLSASASALPGEPLYGIKQAQEELEVRLAPDDQARALALLDQADARLDETARLLRLGRTAEVAQTAQRFDDIVERATSMYVVTIDQGSYSAPTTADMQTKLSQQQQQLHELLQTAPEPARADLREALVTTQRSRALVADPVPVERALGRAGATRSGTAAIIPTLAAENVPTLIPTPTTEPAPAETAPAPAEPT